MNVFDVLSLLAAAVCIAILLAPEGTRCDRCSRRVRPEPFTRRFCDDCSDEIDYRFGGAP